MFLQVDERRCHGCGRTGAVETLQAKKHDGFFLTQRDIQVSFLVLALSWRLAAHFSEKLPGQLGSRCAPVWEAPA